MDFIFLWQRHGSYTSRIREGEGGAGAVSSGAGSAHVLLVFMLACFSHCARMATLLWVKTHMGFLLRQYRCPLATRVVSEKGSRVARPQSQKCRLADFRWKRKWCGATSLPFFTTRRKRKVGGATSAAKSADSRIFGEKGICVARPPEILYFFAD